MELTFPNDVKFRKKRFTPECFAHPAKMSCLMLLWIVGKYTKPGEVILDPMAGIGTTMLASSLGRDVVLVELEEKFVRMMAGYTCDGTIKGYKDVWVEPVEQGWYVKHIGGTEIFPTYEEALAFFKESWKPEVLPEEKIWWQDAEEGYWTKEPIPADCGKHEDHDPHYIEGNRDKMHRDGWMIGGCQIIQGDARNLQGLLCDNIITSPPYSDMSMGGGLNTKPPRAGCNDQSGRNPQSPSQRGAGGYIDKIVTSPPFKEQMQDTGWMDKHQPREHRGKHNPKGQSPDNLGNLPYGNVDSIITSPPYEGTITQGGDTPAHRAKYGYQGRNIGYAEPVDSIITSPPYEGCNQETSSKKRDWQIGNSFGRQLFTHIDNKENIGNLKSQSYLQAMLQVYQSCLSVLKPQGLMILVTKNFLRKQMEIRLDNDTISLCEEAGFILLERHKRKLTQQSFWRIIYQKKYPLAPIISHEDILVFRKRDNG